MPHLKVCLKIRRCSRPVSLMLTLFCCLLLLKGSYGQKPYFVKSDKSATYGMYAYADSLNPAELVYKWNDVRTFENGMAWVYIFKKDSYQDLWGLLDAKGNYIVEPRYSSFTPFYNHFSRVTINGQYGFISRTGREITKIIYDTVTSFSEGLAMVRVKKKWKIIDTTGNIIKDVGGSYAKVGQFSEGMCKVTNEGGLDGYIDASGNEIIPCIYQWARSFKKGKAYVEKTADRYGNTRAGMIDKMGNTVVPFLYNDIKEFINGLAIVSVRSKVSNLPGSIYGLISESGLEIMPPNYSNIEIIFSKWIWGLTYYEKARELRGLDGKLISSENFEMRNYKEGYYIIKVNDKYAVYDNKGKEIIPFKYDYIGEFNAGLAEVKSGIKWGYINMLDSLVFPLKFDEVSPFLGDTALVVFNNKKYNLSRSGTMSVYRVDSSKFTYTIYPRFVFGENLKGQWHVSELNGNPVNLLYDRIQRKGYDFFIGFNKKKQTLFIMGETSTRKIEIPLEHSNRVVEYFGIGPTQNLCGVTSVNGKYGIYNFDNGKEVPAGFSQFRSTAISCEVELDQKWYYVSETQSDFSKGIYTLLVTCGSCKGKGGTPGKPIRVRKEGKRRYIPSSTKTIKSFEYATLPNGEKSKFVTYSVSKKETVPGYYDKEPDTFVDDWEPGITCTVCKGKGNLLTKVKWTGTKFEPIF